RFKNQEDSAHPDELDEKFDTFPTTRPSDIVRMRYDRLRSIAGRIQTVVGDLATQATNYHDLSKFILELSVTTSKSVQAYLGKVEIDFPNDQAVKQCAQDFYPKTIVAFENALEKLDKDPQSAKNDIQAAGNGPGFCEKALQREKFVNPPIHVRNNQIFVLSEAAFLSVNHLT
ncbi:hypothetical protein RYX36_009202, partial [Vicia faba]